MQVGGDHSSIIKKIINIRNAYWATGQELLKKYSWKEDDARIGVFAKCTNNFEPIMYSLMFEKEYLRKPEYQARFSKDHKTPPIKEELDNTCEFYLRHIQMAFADLVFAAIESSCRIFVRALDSDIYDNGTGSFYLIQQYLLKKTRQEQYGNLLKLWRLIRNTQHNNGVYMDPKHPKIIVKYNDQTYPFINNEFVYFVDMELLLDMSIDIKDMFQDIIESEEISRKKEIVDPTFYIKRT